MNASLNHSGGYNMSRKDTDGQSSAGARASTAGDLYHFAWCARRMLDLLHPRRQLELIVMEGDGADKIDLGDGREDYVFTDMSEFYGGDTVATADRIVLTQFKYSYAEPRKAWTLSRLCSAGNSSSTSVIGKMAQDWQRVWSQAGNHCEIRCELRSNQPLADPAEKTLRKLTGYSRAALETLPNSSPVPAEFAESWHQLTAATGLQEDELLRFLDSLSLHGFGATDLRETLGQLGGEVGDWGVPGINSGRERLLEYACERASAGTRRSIRKAHVLEQLGLREMDFSPCPYQPKECEVRVQTQSAETLRDSVRRLNSGLILLHGPAGSGKSVAIQQLAEGVFGLECVVYDFYADGAGLHHGTNVWSVQSCLTQIINDLDGALHTEIFANRQQDTAILRHRFISALGKASAHAARENRKLVIALDAVDNAVEGYNQSRKSGLLGEPALPVLWDIELPDNVVVVASCRTERRASIRAPEPDAEVHIEGFSDVECAHFLRAAIGSSVSDQDAREVWEATRGNPRVLNALVESACQDDSPVGSIVVNAAKKLEALYRDTVARTREWCPEVDAVLALMAEAVLPVDLEALSLVANLDEDEMRSILLSLSIGVALDDGDTAAFRDQDFSDFARDLDAEVLEEARQALATFCVDNESQVSYARDHLPHHLYRAELWDDLVQCLLDRAPARAQTMPTGRREFLRDLHRGLIACARTGRFGDAVKLLVVAAETQNIWGVFHEALSNHPAAAVNCGYHEQWLEELEADRDFQKLFETRLKVGLSLSEGEAEAASVDVLVRQAFEQYRGFREESRGLSLDQCEAFTAMTMEVDGPAHAVDWLASLEGGELSRLFVDAGRRWAGDAPGSCLPDIGDLQISQERQYLLMAGAVSSGSDVPKTHVREACRELAEWVPDAGMAARQFSGVVLDVIASGLSSGARLRDLRQLARCWQPDRPNFMPISADEYEAQVVRYAGWLAVTEVLGVGIDTAESTQTEDAAESETERRRRQGLDEHIDLQLAGQLALWNARAGRDNEAVRRYVIDCLDAWRGVHADFGTRHHRIDEVTRYYQFAAESALRALVLASPPDRDLAREFVELADLITPYPLGLDRMLGAIVDCPAQAPLAEEVTQMARDQLTARDVTADEAVEGLLKLSETVFPSDPESGMELFEEARIAAAGMSGHLHAETDLLASVVRSASDAVADPQSTARRIASAVKRIYSTAWEVPTADTERVFNAVGDLDPVVALETAVWFREAGTCSFEEVAGPAMASAASRTIPARMAWPLSYLSIGSASATECCQNSIERMLLEGNVTAAEVSRAVELGSRSTWLAGGRGELDRIRRFVEWVDEHDLPESDSVAELRELTAAMAVSAPTTKSRSPWIPIDRHEEQVENAVRSLHEDPTAYLAQLGEQLCSGAIEGSVAYAVLMGIATEVPLAQVSDFIEVISGWIDPPIGCYCLNVLMETLTRGGIFGSRREKLIKAALSALETDAAKLLRDHSVDPPGAFGMLIETIGDDWATWAGAMLTAATSELEETRSDGLYALAAMLADKLSPEKASELLEFVLERWAGQDGPPITPDLERDESTTAISQLLCRFLGHPEQALRWRSAHALVEICVSDPDRTMPILIDAARDEKLDRWMSVREWTMFVVRCVALRDPACVAPYVAQLAAFALDDDLPHACIREHVKQALIHIANCCSESVTDELLAQTRLVNSPVACKLDRTDEPGRPIHQRYNDNQYRFDAADTMPYVFSPLARCFGKHRCDVCDAAREWLERRGVRKHPPLPEDRVNRMARGDGEKYYARQGLHAAIQRCSDYYERHLVQIVAGQWIETIPVYCKSDVEGEPGEWEDWLRSEGNPADPGLTARLLDAPPPLADCWRIWDEELGDWLEARAEDEFRAEVLADDEERAVVLASRWTSDHDRSLNVSVRSAVVPSETAAAYGRMLVSQQHLQHLPPYFEGQYWAQLTDYDNWVRPERFGELGIPPFQAEPMGMLVDTEFSYHGFDPLWPSHGRGLIALSSAVGARLDLNRESPLQLRWQGRDGRMAARSRIWHREQGEFATRGRQLLMTRDAVRKLLSYGDFDLVTMIAMRKRESYRRGGPSDPASREDLQVLLIGKDGGVREWIRA